MELMKAIYSSEAHTIAANSNYIFVVYFKILATFKIIKNSNTIVGIEFYKSLNIPESYNYLSVNESNEIVGANIYNRSKSNQEQNSLVHIYRFNDDKLEKQVSFNPKFNNVEFSHFNPHHWISDNSKYIACSQTTTYEVNIYDKNGNWKYRFDCKKSGWVEMDKKTMNKFKETIPDNFPGILIDSLSKYNDKFISRIEGVWFINEDSLLVRYYMYDSISKLKIRYFDLYKVNDGSAILLAENMIDGKFPIDIYKIVTKTNFDMLTWNYSNLISNNEIIITKNFAPISHYLGRAWTDIKKEEEQFYKNNDPLFSIIIFKISK
jgi:hypothetical protein